MNKERLTVTVDPDLVHAATEAVAEGRVDSLSAWVNLALADRAAKDRRLRALAGAVREYERKFGRITADEIAAQARADRASARVVRGPRTSPAKPRRSRSGAA
jgi:Arc/MetJ-type ribon-helix-helix transcriptional regulator